MFFQESISRRFFIAAGWCQPRTSQIERLQWNVRLCVATVNILSERNMKNCMWLLLECKMQNMAVRVDILLIRLRVPDAQSIILFIIRFFVNCMPMKSENTLHATHGSNMTMMTEFMRNRNSVSLSYTVRSSVCTACA